MAICSCPQVLESMSQLCASCEADYLRYLDEIQSTQPEEDNTRPATLAEMKQLEAWDWEQHAHAASAISLAHETFQRLTARIVALETNQSTHAAAFAALSQRINKLANHMGGKAA